MQVGHIVKVEVNWNKHTDLSEISSVDKYDLLSISLILETSNCGLMGGQSSNMKRMI